MVGGNLSRWWQGLDEADRASSLKQAVMRVGSAREPAAVSAPRTRIHHRFARFTNDGVILAGRSITDDSLGGCYALSSAQPGECRVRLARGCLARSADVSRSDVAIRYAYVGADRRTHSIYESRLEARAAWRMPAKPG